MWWFVVEWGCLLHQISVNWVRFVFLCSIPPPSFVGLMFVRIFFFFFFKCCYLMYSRIGLVGIFVT